MAPSPPPVLLSDAEYRRFFRSPAIGMLRLRSDGRIVGANPFLCGRLQYSQLEVNGKLLAELGGLPGSDAEQPVLRALLQRGYLRSADLPLIRKDGASLYFEFRRLGSLADQTELIECHFQSFELSPQGLITRLPAPDNTEPPLQPLDFEGVANREIELTRSQGRPLSLLSIMIDRPDRTSDPRSATVSLPLDEFARACTSVLRTSDSVGQLDEAMFQILLPGTPARGALRTAERLRSAFAAMAIPTAHGQFRSITVSIGAVTTRTGLTSYLSLRSRADAKRDDARSCGGNRIVAGRGG
ncbi:MAG: diguanylate cyclase with sensor [Hydrocarboniphaga sp.]|uniref:diguanylate cyclase n=1 Tax=Hydrocarboniphaga sp. TaxID=2033016 RepID=UPI0026338DDB|nr:diguanylate cyclase [Hydrocarboniphaga sp.]MDB5969249.1 diguanylate cyclase with sensor [Hydrocarboniphaga sp.]